MVEDENGYGDEGFEEYSDEFEGEGDEVLLVKSQVGVNKLPTTWGAGSRERGGGGSAVDVRQSESPVVSPALKMRHTEDLQVPDNKVRVIWTF